MSYANENVRKDSFPRASFFIIKYKNCPKAK